MIFLNEKETADHSSKKFHRIQIIMLLLHVIRKLEVKQHWIPISAEKLETDLKKKKNAKKDKEK